MGLKFGNKNKRSFKMKGAPIQKGTAMYKKMVSPVKEDPITTTKSVQDDPVVTETWNPPVETFKGGAHGAGQITQTGTQTTTTKGYKVTKTYDEALKDYLELNPNKSKDDFDIDMKEWQDKQKKVKEKQLSKTYDKPQVQITAKKDVIPEIPKQRLQIQPTSSGIHQRNKITINGVPQTNHYQNPNDFGTGIKTGSQNFNDQQIDHMLSSGNWKEVQHPGGHTYFERNDPRYTLMTGVDGSETWVIPGSKEHRNIERSNIRKENDATVLEDWNTKKENGELSKIQLAQGLDAFQDKAWAQVHKSTRNMSEADLQESGLWSLTPNTNYSETSDKITGREYATASYLSPDDVYFSDDHQGHAGVKTNPDADGNYDIEGGKYVHPDSPNALNKEQQEQLLTHELELTKQMFPNAKIVKSGDGYVIDTGEEMNIEE